MLEPFWRYNLEYRTTSCARHPNSCPGQSDRWQSWVESRGMRAASCNEAIHWGRYARCHQSLFRWSECTAHEEIACGVEAFIRRLNDSWMNRYSKHIECADCFQKHKKRENTNQRNDWVWWRYQDLWFLRHSTETLVGNKSVTFLSLCLSWMIMGLVSARNGKIDSGDFAGVAESKQSAGTPERHNHVGQHSLWRHYFRKVTGKL